MQGPPPPPQAFLGPERETLRGGRDGRRAVGELFVSQLGARRPARQICGCARTARRRKVRLFAGRAWAGAVRRTRGDLVHAVHACWLACTPGKPVKDDLLREESFFGARATGIQGAHQGYEQRGRPVTATLVYVKATMHLGTAVPTRRARFGPLWACGDDGAAGPDVVPKTSTSDAYGVYTNNRRAAAMARLWVRGRAAVRLRGKHGDKARRPPSGTGSGSSPLPQTRWNRATAPGPEPGQGN